MQMLVLQYPCAGFSFVANFSMETHNEYIASPDGKSGDSNANVC